MAVVVNQYMFLPGCCGFCRSNNLPTIDTGINLDHYNDPNSDNPSADNLLYMCADCAINFAQMVIESRNLEIKQAGSLGTAEAMVDNLNEVNIELAKRIDELENALRVINTVKPTPASSPAKKAFKPVPADEVEV